MPISVVVPATLDDRAHLEALLAAPPPGAADLVVSVPRDEWARFDRMRGDHPGVVWARAPRGRGSQMNAGAALARGEWLVFLHADTRLPERWRDGIAEAAGDPAVAGGCFRFALDDPGWRARLVERGVRIRVALFALPYGDQALFVRRAVFDAIGGYADVPLMEDVEFVRRLARAGRLAVLPLAATTSARRWHRDGWLRRTAGNATLIGLYAAGVLPARLARRYRGEGPVAVAMMARDPGGGGKSRLSPGLAPEAHAALRLALFEDTLEAVRAVGGVRHVVACEPAGAEAAVRARVGPGVEVVPQPGGDLGARMHGVLDDLLRRGARAAIVVGSDLPDLPPGHVEAAAVALRRRGDRVVVGPAGDGGYYLIGINAAHPEVFAGVEWGTNQVLRQTLDRARASRVAVQQLPAWRDVDEPADLRRLAASTAPGAPRTRAWISRYAPQR